MHQRAEWLAKVDATPSVLRHVTKALTTGQMITSWYLHPGSAFLPNMVAVHDVEDLISDGLSIAASADTAQHVAHPLLSNSTCPPMSLDKTRDSLTTRYWLRRPIQDEVV